MSAPVRYRSTRGAGEAVSAEAAILSGAAPDGGLYLPDRLPRADMAEFDPEAPLPAFAARWLAAFFEGGRLGPALGSICAEAFAEDTPLARPDPARPGLLALELFHGPTGAFKDYGARFLAACLDRLAEPGRPMTVLAATSGDTGGAVGSAVEGRRGVTAGVLFPAGRVSAFQERQLCCWDAPVRAFRVAGDFDACQGLVKAAFRDAGLSRRFGLTSANSINIARLLPQSAYLARACLAVQRETGAAPGLVMPSGNLGHGFAAVLARACGAPVGPILLATNANPAIETWVRTGERVEPASVRTLANAMDVGAPSNLERLAAWAQRQAADDPGAPPRLGLLAERVEDAAIAARIRADHAASGYVWCPHSACAAEAYARLPEAERAARPWIAAATAHPFKFADVVEPLIGARLAPTAPLARVLERAARAEALDPDLDALAAALASAPRPVRVA